MFDRLDQLEARYEELGRQLSDPKIVNDQENYRKVSKAYRDIEPTVEKFREYRKIKEGIAEAKAMLADADPDVRAMAAGGVGGAGAAARAGRRAVEGAAAAQGPERREERDSGAARGHRRG